jgi:hypothetical protein
MNAPNVGIRWRIGQHSKDLGLLKKLLGIKVKTITGKGIKMTLEVLEYTDLDTLYSDIAEASKGRDDLTENNHTPLNIEIYKGYEKLKKDLFAHGSYGGIRHESELLSQIWTINGTSVAFIKKT